jgi:hypothetical protein
MLILGEMAQMCMEKGIRCSAVQSSDDKGSSLVKILNMTAEDEGESTSDQSQSEYISLAGSTQCCRKAR